MREAAKSSQKTVGCVSSNLDIFNSVWDKETRQYRRFVPKKGRGGRGIGKKPDHADAIQIVTTKKSTKPKKGRGNKEASTSCDKVEVVSKEDKNRKLQSGLQQGSLLWSSTFSSSFLERQRKKTDEGKEKPDNRVVARGVFSGVMVAFEFGSIRSAEKTRLRSLVTDHGGVVSHIITKQVDYMVVCEVSRAECYKVRAALKYGVAVVSADLLDTCVADRSLADADKFLVAGEARAQRLAHGKIPATGKKKRGVKGPPPSLPAVDLRKLPSYDPQDPSCPPFPEDNYSIAKFAILRSEPRDGGVRDVAVLELHVTGNDATRDFRVLLQRGVMSDDFTPREEKAYRPAGDLEAQAVYSTLYRSLTEAAPGGGLGNSHQHVHGVGSHKLQQLMTQWAASEGNLEPEVARVVSLLWREASGDLQEILAKPIASLKTDDVDRAQGVLLRLRGVLQGGGARQQEERAELEQQYFACLPHSRQHSSALTSVRDVARELELCQLCRDVLSAGEATRWILDCGPAPQYRALGCHVTHIPHASDVIGLINDSLNDSDVGLEVVNVFAVERDVETTNFRSDLHNRHLVFHASAPRNFVGILSRGLLPPRVQEAEVGERRHDVGMLGSGLYFALNPATSVQYSGAARASGSRFMLVSEVALGTVCDTEVKRTDLTCPPAGHHSVHGKPGPGSFFKESEYCVYAVEQQRCRYLVEFSTPVDRLLPFTPGVATSPLDAPHAEADDAPVGVIDVVGVEDPLAAVQGGLQGDHPVPLTAVHVRASLIDLAARARSLWIFVCNLERV